MKTLNEFYTRAMFVIVSIIFFLGSTAYLSAKEPAVAADEPGIHLLDISSLGSPVIDKVCALPVVEGWFELGGGLILVGEKSFGAELTKLVPNARCTVYSGTRDQLRLARTESPAAAKALVRDTRILFGLGRYAVILGAPDVVNQEIKIESSPGTLR